MTPRGMIFVAPHDVAAPVGAGRPRGPDGEDTRP